MAKTVSETTLERIEQTQRALRRNIEESKQPAEEAESLVQQARREAAEASHNPSGPPSALPSS